jgi:hypothetical protein
MAEDRNTTLHDSGAPSPMSALKPDAERNLVS